MRNKTVADRYTPLENVFMLEANGKLDHSTMRQVTVQVTAKYNDKLPWKVLLVPKNKA